MIDPDVLKRMVELAPGWEWRTIGNRLSDVWYPFYDGAQIFSGDCLSDNQQLLDALAAELVRLVDAKEVSIRFSDLGSCKVGGRNYSPQNWHHKDDRTANTINAIDQFHRENPGVLGK